MSGCTPWGSETERADYFMGQNKDLRAKITRLERELEAAKRFMREMAEDPNWCKECAKCPCVKDRNDWRGCSGFEWRGVAENCDINQYAEDCADCGFCAENGGAS